MDVPHAEVDLLQVSDPLGGVKQGAGHAHVLQALAEVATLGMVGAQLHSQLLVLLLQALAANQILSRRGWTVHQDVGRFVR